MKKTQGVALFCLLLFIINSCATFDQDSDEALEGIPITVVQEDAVYAQGDWSGAEFSSEWFGFRYRPAKGIIVTSESALKEINAIQSMNFDGPNAELEDYTKMQIAYEVMARSGDGTTTLEVLSEKIFADDLTVDQYVEILINELSITHGRDVVFNETVPIRLGNTYYLDLSATMSIEGTTVYQTILISQKGDRFATVVLNYKEVSIKDELIAQFFPY